MKPDAHKQKQSRDWKRKNQPAPVVQRTVKVAPQLSNAGELPTIQGDDENSLRNMILSNPQDQSFAFSAEKAAATSQIVSSENDQFFKLDLEDLALKLEMEQFVYIPHKKSMKYRIPEFETLDEPIVEEQTVPDFPINDESVPAKAAKVTEEAAPKTETIDEWLDDLL